MKANKHLIGYISELNQNLLQTSAIYIQSINGCNFHFKEVEFNDEMILNIDYLLKYFKKNKKNLIINDEKEISVAYEANQLRRLFLITLPFLSDNNKKSFNWVKVNSLKESELDIAISINFQGQLLQVLNY